MTEEGRKEKERGQEHTQWGEVGEGEAVCGVSVTCPGGVAWVECAALACACGGGGRDRGRETQAGQGQHSVCVYGGGGGGGGRGGAGCECVCVGLHVWRVGRDRAAIVPSGEYFSSPFIGKKKGAHGGHRYEMQSISKQLLP